VADQAKQDVDLPPFTTSVYSIRSSIRRLKQALQANPTLEAELRTSIASIAAQGDEIFESIIDVLERLASQDASSLARMMHKFDQTMQRNETQFLKATPEEAIALVAGFIKLTSSAIHVALREDPLSHDQRHLQFQHQRISVLLSSINLLQEREEVKQVGVEVRQIAENAQEAAGQAATSGIAAFYQERADLERIRHLAWSALLLASTIAGVWIGWFVISRTAGSGLTVNELARATVALPVFLLAAYSSRQANYHRNAESDARNIAVQLKTVRAYSDALDTSARQEVLRLLGTKIFGHPSAPSISATSTIAAGPDATEGPSADMIQLFRALLPGGKNSEST